MVRRSTWVAVGALLVSLGACAVGDGDSGELETAVRRGAAAGGDPSGTTSAPLPDDPLVPESSKTEDTVLDPEEPEQLGKDEMTDPALAAATVPPVILYLNGRGATMSPGRNDSSKNTSQIVTSATTFPPSKYASDATRWARLVATVKEHFALYNVAVVDTEPAAPPYLEALITNGPPSLIGYGDSLGGIAPTRCGIIATSVVYIFDRRMASEVDVAEVASHELGHSLSLSHTQTPTDLMSYSNSRTRFENLAAACGPTPSQPQSCNCGGSTQNNVEQLLRFLGPATGEPPPPPPPPPPPGGEPPPPPPPTSPSVAILAPADGSTYVPNQRLDVKADASKVPGLTRMSLRWKIGNTTYSYGCPSTTCSVANNVYTWRMVPGSGTRFITARATGAGGQTYDSPTIRITSR
jgi:hypothetical protein